MDGYLTRREVSELLRVSNRTVYRWVLAGKLREVGVGRRPLYRPEDVRAAVESSEDVTALGQGKSRHLLHKDAFC